MQMTGEVVDCTAVGSQLTRREGHSEDDVLAG